jgi:TM2 domain-containing membrane protein YozV
MNMEQVSPKSRRTAALLAFFLGILGVHRFYLGRTITATTMLILTVAYLCTVRMWDYYSLIFLGIAGLWALVDFILVVSGLMKDNGGRPIKNWQG